jgi:hypothetical protein
MSKMGFAIFRDYETPTNYVAPKSSHSKEQFEEECKREADGYWSTKEVEEKFVRWFPRIPEEISLDSGFDEGCWGFCKPGRGAFPVWSVEVEPLEEGEQP